MQLPPIPEYRASVTKEENPKNVGESRQKEYDRGSRHNGNGATGRRRETIALQESDDAKEITVPNMHS